VHIVEEDAARKSLDEAETKWAGALDAWEAATWVLVHDPTVGVPVTESGKTRSFTYEGARSIKQPTITLLYEIRGDTTVIHDAFFKEAPFGQVGRA
jgi:hypothetical protein